MRKFDANRFVFVGALMASGCSSLWPFGESKKNVNEPVASAQPSTNTSAPQASTGQSLATTTAVSPHATAPAAAVAGTEAGTAAGTAAGTEAESRSANVDNKAKSPGSSYPSEGVDAVAVPGGVTLADSAKSGDPALMQARTTARLDELESEIRRLREKVKLLEQGLLTGIAPDDLKKPKAGKSAKADKNPPVVSEASDLSKPEIEDLSLPPKKSEAMTEGDSALNARLQLAKEHYQAARFGLAVAELAGLSREFGPKAHDGAIKAWLGKSYLALKEYSTARGEFEYYLKEWPSGALIGDVRLGLAKTYFAMGLRERARLELKKVIKDFDGQEHAEIASAELQKMQGSL
jgi:TolA-binding protein